MHKNNKVLTLYISNLSEDVWPFISSMHPNERKTEIAENADLSERDLYNFCELDDIAYILPVTPSGEFLKHFHAITGKKDQLIFTPRVHTGEICKDIQADKILLKKLVTLAYKYSKLIIKSYCASQNLYSLATYLKSLGIVVELPQAPSIDDRYLVEFYGSKSGIRQLITELHTQGFEFTMSPGVICTGKSLAVQMAANMHLREKGVVLKTNRGHSGAGVLIYTPSMLSDDLRMTSDELGRKLAEERYWDLFPIIVEKYIEPDYQIGGGFPNIEVKIAPDGTVELLYYCGMRVTKAGVFKGVEIGTDVLPSTLVQRITKAAHILGKALADKGYRGYFEIDFIAGKDGKIYVTEANIRRTGGTHVYKLAKFLFGNFTSRVYTLSNNLHALDTDKPLSGSQLLSSLSPIIFSSKTKEGVVITGTKLIEQNYFGYVIFGKSKRRALEIEMEMEVLLKKLSN